MRRPEVPIENEAQIVWGLLVVVYLIAAGRPEFLQPPVVAVFVLSALAALLELWLRKQRWPHIAWYDSIIWSILLSGMVIVTGGRGSEVWPAYILMSLTAPAVLRREVPYILLGINSSIYGFIYLFHNPFGAPLDLGLLGLRIGTIFLVAYVVDRSTSRERKANQRAVQLARERVGELVQARDAERQRIASDIHDWLGSGLIAPMRRLEIALRATDEAHQKQQIEEASEALRRSHAELRRLMENLHPHLLEQMGLAEALRAYLQEWGEEQGVAITYQLEAGPEPPADLALALFRIQQEALNNVGKHADATQVKVRLRLGQEQIDYSLTDDGRGFVGEGRPGGRGLTGMRERATYYGGSVRISSVPGQGSRVEAQLPLRGSHGGN